MDDYKINCANLAAIREHIFRTIDQSANLLIEDKASVHDILSELQKRYKPDTTLKARPAGKKQFNAWIKGWIETSDEKYAILDFMYTIKEIYKSFVELITKFENSTKAKHGGSVYATLGGDNAGSNGSNQGNLNNNKLKKRWCGELRLIYEDNWTLDLKIIKKVTEAAASRKSLKTFIDKHKKEDRPKASINVNAVFRTSSDDDPLVDSVIYNSSATESISNSIDRMEDFKPERIYIRGFRGDL
ncbi:hypothetical protein TMatcc_010136 [Talaromyces marneffei ATCC 18224]